jgi:hypothetical protein
MLTIILAVAISASVFGIIWYYVAKKVTVAWQGQPGTFTPMDSRNNPVPFDPRHERYMKVAEVVTALASASLVFIPSSRLSVYPHSCAFAMALLGFVVLYSVLFTALLTYFYESFLYDDLSYAAWKYGLVHALGFGGLLCFAVAYVVLAIRVGWAEIYAIAPAVTSKFY